MIISVLDFVLINFVSFIFGMGSGFIICIKNKDKLLIIKSRSRDNLSHLNPEPYPVMASAPPATVMARPQSPKPVKITVE